MGINVEHLKRYVIVPTLKGIDLYSPSAVNLLLGTAAQESRMGEFLHQINGPALGIYQMEPATHDDILDNYILHKRDLASAIINVTGVCSLNSKHLVSNLAYATALTRIHYLRVKDPLPKYNNIPLVAAYWKKYYNTIHGRGTEGEFIANFQRFIGTTEVE